MKGLPAFLSFLLFSLPQAVGAELKLKPVHPDEPVEYTLNQRFSLANALSRLGTIRDYLTSFRGLTEAAKGKIAPRVWKGIGNTDWETQALGFANHPAAIEGALRYQNYLLKKALCELAAAQAQVGRAPAKEVERARRDFAQAEKEFQAFWDALGIAD
jgi:hypothetical protein